MLTAKLNRSWVTPLVLFSLTVLTRLPFQSRILYHWDSVNFALGIEHYDVYLHQPHPPGYFLYVMLGRLINLLVDDVNGSLVWISVLSAGLGVMSIYLLGQLLWNRASGVVAALTMVSSPLVWFHGEVALSYMTEAVFVTLIAFVCYRHMARNDGRLWLSALLLGLAGGFRPNTLLFLLPLWAVSAWRFRWRRLVIAVVVLAVTCAGWLLPMVALTGGVSRYLAALGGAGRLVARESSFFDMREIVVNAGRLVIIVGYALTSGVALLIVGIVHWGIRHLGQWRLHLRNPKAPLFFWWIAPSLAFYLFIHIRQQGHSFTFMPAVFLILSFVLVEVIPQVIPDKGKGRGWCSICCAVVVLTNLTFFFIAPPFLFGQRRQVLSTPSWASVRTRNVIVSAKLQYIQDHFSPGDTAILVMRFDRRLPDYYLRDYRSLCMDYECLDDTGILTLDGVQVLVLFSEEIEVDSRSCGVLSQQTLGGGGVLRWLELAGGEKCVLSAPGVRIVSSAVD